jgi:hypothetical protein
MATTQGDTTTDAGEATFAVHAQAPVSRCVAAAAFASSRVMLPLMLLAILVSQVPITPMMVIRSYVLFFGVPAAVAWAAGVAARARLVVGGADVALVRRHVRIDVPLDAIARIVPWTVPLPEPGFALVLRSGRRLRPGVGVRDPVPVVAALAARGVPDARVTAHPAVVYAHARAGAGRWRWWHLALRFPVFALGPTAILFNAHQHIAYGGLFGEWYLLGPERWFATLAIYWATVTIYQVLYASVLRGVGEVGCAVAAVVAPPRAAGVRRAAELVIRGLYYGGVPALLALRFAPW